MRGVLVSKRMQREADPASWPARDEAAGGCGAGSAGSAVVVGAAPADPRLTHHAGCAPSCSTTCTLPASLDRAQRRLHQCMHTGSWRRRALLQPERGTANANWAVAAPGYEFAAAGGRYCCWRQRSPTRSPWSLQAWRLQASLAATTSKSEHTLSKRQRVASARGGQQPRPNKDRNDQSERKRPSSESKVANQKRRSLKVLGPGRAPEHIQLHAHALVKPRSNVGQRVGTPTSSYRALVKLVEEALWEGGPSAGYASAPCGGVGQRARRAWDAHGAGVCGSGTR